MNNQHKFYLSLLFTVAMTAAIAQKTALKDYNVTWNTPGGNSQGSMPIGNGDIGANVWVEENGDLVFYVSKTDAWSENGRILKLGKVRVSITPKPIEKKAFLQELKLEQGEIFVNYGNTQLKFWVDANHPTIQVDVNSKTPVNVAVSFESWRKKRHHIKGGEANSIWGFGESGGYTKDCFSVNYQEADTILTGFSNQIVNCHHNTYSRWRKSLEIQALQDFANNNTDPLLNLNYGILIESKGLTNKNDTLLVSNKASDKFQINIYALTQQGTIDAWKNGVVNKAMEIQKIPAHTRENAHYNWWKDFWNKHYIFATAKDSVHRKEAEKVTEGYILQRFINACGGRGNFPIKFNGSIFTVDTYNRSGEQHKGYDADYRAWGGCYWFQNTRLPYWTMLVSGDFELMKPFFQMYVGCGELRKAAVKKYYNHDGINIPETINFWGTYADGDYGCNRTGLPDGKVVNTFIHYYWSGGLELSLIMLDYYSFTNNEKFAKDTLVPFVSEILTFFDQHWKRGDDGKILFSPAAALETWQTATNPTPEITGISAVASKMLSLPRNLVTEQQRQQWTKLYNDLPAVPMMISNSDTLIAPAQEFSQKSNGENAELYSVFPYRTYCYGKPNLDLAKRTYAERLFKGNGGWNQHSIQAAYLGMTDEAKKMIVESFSTWDNNFRFPAFWGPNYDWTPDQDHGNVAMIALQRMIIQYENDTVYLMPAWPKEWDVNFKVNVPNNTSIEGVYENGNLIQMKSSTEKNKIKVVRN